MKIEIRTFIQRAKIPNLATSGSVGFDLYSADEKIISPRSSSLVRTDVGFAIPKDYFGKTYAHSIWAKRFTGVGGPAIDSDYRGGVLVIFCNYSDDWIQINKEEKFAQIVFYRKTNSVYFEEVENFEDKTEHGLGDFGSSDRKCQAQAQKQ